jgi:hypothetical protein
LQPYFDLTETYQLKKDEKKIVYTTHFRTFGPFLVTPRVLSDKSTAGQEANIDQASFDSKSDPKAVLLQKKKR